MQVSLNKKYTDGEGRAIRILGIFAQGEYPVKGEYRCEISGSWLSRTWTRDGKCINDGIARESDLVEVNEEPLLPGHRWLTEGDKLQAGDTYYHLGEVTEVEEKYFGKEVNLEEAFMRKIETPEPKPATTISMDKTYKTRSGLAFRCYQTDAGGKYPVHGATWSATAKCWQQNTWTAEGAYRYDGPSDLDLVEVKPRIQREYWVNLYRNDKKGSMWKTQKDANEAAIASKDRIACVKVVIDCEEGEGL